MSWQLDEGHTHVGFTCRHMMVSTVRGEFEKVRGRVAFDEHDLTASSADIQIEVASVSTHSAQRDEHLCGADFFDVEQYPLITFKSKRVLLTDAHHGQLIGDLTIRDVTREVVLDGEFGGVSQTPWQTYSAGFTLRGKINRKEWGLKWNMVLADGGLAIGNEITLTIDLELTRPVEAVAPVQAAGIGA